MLMMHGEMGWARTETVMPRLPLRYTFKMIDSLQRPTKAGERGLLESEADMVGVAGPGSSQEYGTYAPLLGMDTEGIWSRGSLLRLEMLVIVVA